MSSTRPECKYNSQIKDSDPNAPSTPLKFLMILSESDFYKMALSQRIPLDQHPSSLNSLALSCVGNYTQFDRNIDQALLEFI